VHRIVCVAGVEQEIIRELQKLKSSELARKGNIPLIVKPLKSDVGYSASYANELIRKIHAELAKRPDVAIGIVLAYNKEPPNSEVVRNAFSPFALSAPFEARPVASFPKFRRRKCIEECIKDIQQVVASLATASSSVKDFVSGRHDRPVNLPVCNFHSAILKSNIRELCHALSSSSDPAADLRAFEEDMCAKHTTGKLRLGPDQYRYIQDDRKLRFKSPGRDKHGLARAAMQTLAGTHNPSCHVALRSRLGAPVQRNFHFDCDVAPNKNPDQTAKSKVRINGIAFVNCHGSEPTTDRSKTHVNIAPNDMVF
jgi:hypothetical protein